MASRFAKIILLLVLCFDGGVVAEEDELLISAADLHLLENYELSLLRDFVRGRGRGSVSRVPVNSFIADEAEQESKISLIAPTADASAARLPAMQTVDANTIELNGEFSSIVPRMLMSPSSYFPAKKMKAMEKPLLSIPAPENPNTNSDVDKTRNVKSKSESDEPTNEDYEKLAKLLQQFVSNRKGVKSNPSKSTNELKDIPSTSTTTTTSVPLIFSSPTPLSTNISKVSWHGSVEKLSARKPIGVGIASSLRPLMLATVDESHEASTNPTTTMTTSGRLFGRVRVQPSSKTSDRNRESNNEFSNQKFVQLTSHNDENRQRLVEATSSSSNAEDIELKIREISRELSNVLHEIKREKDAQMPERQKQSLDVPSKSQSFLDNRKKTNKAYVTILREGLARQTNSNQYTFVASITLIRDEGKIILVDTGLGTDINGRTDLIKQLTKLNIVPPRVNYVITTHGHADHAGNTNDFPDAIHYQGVLSYHRNKFNFTDLFEKNSFFLTSNTQLLKTPGHTSDDISVLIHNTDKYGTMAVVGDVFIAAEDLDYPMMWRPLAWNETMQEESRKELICAADYIVPGHGKVFRVSSQIRNRFLCPTTNAMRML